MTIKEIKEIENPIKDKLKPIKEKQDIFIPDIVNQNISRINGMVYCLTGSGGSGKTSLLLNMFKSKNFYRNKFHNIYYICPSASFSSVKNHPFSKHNKVYHELTVPLLDEIYNELIAKKEEATKEDEKKDKKKVYIDEEQQSEEEEEKEIEYSTIIIDDFASSLKENDVCIQLNKMIIKARHLCCSFIFTLQSYYYFPKMLRKQITYITIFKPKNVEELTSIARELFNMNNDDALKIFNYCFNQPYTHLDVDLVENKYYKNFNQLLIEN